nr:hypothetical protein [Microbacterium hydrocarbonoxydans]
MDAAAERELRELRARAYGRDADIAMDAAAVRRLHELESARSDSVTAERRTRTPNPRARTRAEARAATAPESPPTASRPDRSPVTEHDADGLGAIERSVDDDSAADEAETDDAGRDDRRTRRRATWWAASVVGSAALAAVVTFTLTSTPAVSASSGAPQIETLRLTAASDRIPVGWFGAEDDTIAADYLGFTVFTIPGWYEVRDEGDDASNCIAVVKTSQIPPVDRFDQNDWSYGGDVYSGCGIGVFPATVEIPIRGGAPEEFLAGHPEADALQLVLDGDRVGVFLDSGSD